MNLHENAICLECRAPDRSLLSFECDRGANCFARVVSTSTYFLISATLRYKSAHRTRSKSRKSFFVPK